MLIWYINNKNKVLSNNKRLKIKNNIKLHISNIKNNINKNLKYITLIYIFIYFTNQLLFIFLLINNNIDLSINIFIIY